MLYKKKKQDKMYWLKNKSKRTFLWAPKLLDGLKCGSEVKLTEEQGVRAHFLARNTLGVEGCVGVLGWD